jgi:hypothetical protein
MFWMVLSFIFGVSFGVIAMALAKFGHCEPLNCGAAAIIAAVIVFIAPEKAGNLEEPFVSEDNFIASHINPCWRFVKNLPSSSLPFHFDAKYIKSVDCISKYTVMVYLSDCFVDGQLEIRTAVYICKKYRIKYNPKTIRQDLLNDVYFNIEVGLAALNEEMKRADGNLKLAILSYKCGGGTIRESLFISGRQCIFPEY